VHRYTFPASGDARIVIDCSMGGLRIDHGATVPLRAHLEVPGPNAACAEIRVEGAPLTAYVECDAGDWRPTLWYDRRLMPGSTRLDFDHIRPTTLRPFGLMWRGPATEGQTVELRLGFSLRGVEQAEANARADCGTAASVFDKRRAATEAAWRDHLGAISVDAGDGDGAHERTTTFATALYHSMVKPAFAPAESPFWPSDGPFVFDIATMWDIYRTQLPLITALFPQRAVDLAIALLTICEEEGNLPIGYRMARGADRFARQGSGLAHTFLADVCQLDAAHVGGGRAAHAGIDWDWALVNMHSDLRRGYAEDFLERGVAHPISHTLDVAFAYRCSAVVARHVGDDALAGQFDALAERWIDAFDPDTGLLVDSTFYEGGKWNYSFRLLHDMASRIELAGGDEAFVEMLDRFFGFDAEPVKLPGEKPSRAELAAGAALDRFEGLNNEPDMEVPWAYSYAGRADRTADVVHAVRTNQFGTGRGGLPGNDDSGGLSSWYVWAALGLFPVAGQQLFIVHPPAFRSSALAVAGGAFRIDAPGFEPRCADEPAQYIQSVELDGVRLSRLWLHGTEVHGGGHLVVALGDDPAPACGLQPPPSGASTATSSPPLHPRRPIRSPARPHPAVPLSVREQQEPAR
jgi:putative alpha-1,2-mannosidase